MYTRIEHIRLQYLVHDQPHLRADLYSMNVLAEQHIPQNFGHRGRLVVLPSLFTGAFPGSYP